jgi:hypothetical protein
MPKTGSGARKPQTHFEQVPLAVVKEIAEIDDVEETPSGMVGHTVERLPEKMVKSGRVPTRTPVRKK